MERCSNAALARLAFEWLQLYIALTPHTSSSLEAYLILSPTCAGIEVFRGTTSVRWPPAKRDGQPKPTRRVYRILPRYGKCSPSATVRSDGPLLPGRA
jgi:hypothetical protein